MKRDPSVASPWTAEARADEWAGAGAADRGAQVQVGTTATRRVATDPRRPPFAPVRVGTTSGRMMVDEDDEQAEPPEARDLGERLEAATDRIRAAVVRLLLRAGEVHPRLVGMAVALVAGEPGAGAALAGGQGHEMVLGELAEVVREAGREHHQASRMVEMPAAGSA